ncbi:hypothetical protein GPECTOR_1g219 [Gonium pectorale]|uniref:Ribonuclease H2 subunit B wHTH domain-containing protein n=1 Tax=Gonium pectorale TaxID=33097 RepID=A0A150H2B9_GONPE|nr:hypothetical protein GPECTOR_1g219 [Gonium pectorale]|eukprot:KXZ56251.1 hypothetical protein GPECTOR_1g219 [Gonium pectorale]
MHGGAHEQCRPQGFLLHGGGELLEVNRFKQAYSAWLAGERLLADGGLFLATPYDPLFALLPILDRARDKGFLLHGGGELLEVNRFKQAYSAWLAGERLLADGGLFLATPYDPLFALLPILDRARDKDEASPAGKFKELDELLYDASAPGLSELLKHARKAAADGGGSGGVASEASAPMDASEPGGAPAPLTAAGGASGAAEAGHLQMERPAEEAGGSATALAAPRGPAPRRPASLEEQLSCICDVRKVDDMCYYRLNEQRVLAWLLCKVRQLRVALSAQVTGMDEGHATAYVLAFLSEYVGDPWVGMLSKHLGISTSAPASGTTAAALQPADSNAQPAPRHTPPPLSGGPPEKKQKVDPRAAAKQAALAKQAVGTKKLTSFFTKK